MNPKIQNYVSEVTAGLRADPELQLDVRAELSSHIESVADEQQRQGRSEVESVEVALKCFGKPTDIAADLVSANHRRMKFRAWIRTVAQVILVPAAILLAIWMTIDTVQRVRVYAAIASLANVNSSPWSSPWETIESRACRGWRLSPRDRTIVFGDWARTSRVDQAKAVWELDPTNRVFYAHYLRARTSYDRADWAGLEQDLQKGEDSDPDNALYSYLLAGLMVDRSCEWKNEVIGTNSVRTFIVKDRDLLDRAMVRLRQANNRPRYQTYAPEMMVLRMSLIPRSRNLEQELTRIGILAGALLPEVSLHRNLVRASIAYGEMLVKEGKTDEAVPYLQAWCPLAEGITRDSWTLIEVLVASALADIGEKEALPVLESIGRKDPADSLRKRSVALTGPVHRWRQSVRESRNDRWIVKASVLAGLLLPALGDEGITEADLAPGRMLDYVLLEQAAVATWVVAFLCVLLLMGGIALYWRKAPGAASAPFLIVPDWRNYTRILGFSVVLPLVLYLVYTQLTGLSGREYSFKYVPGRYTIEVSLLGVLILVLAMAFTVRHVRNRCQVLGIPVPRGPFERVQVWFRFRRHEHALFVGTVARSVLPILATVILLLTLLVQPWLAREETRLIQSDPLLSQGPRVAGFTAVETRLVDRLKKEMLTGSVK